MVAGMKRCLRRRRALSLTAARCPISILPKKVPDWGALGVDVVVDCTGRAVTRLGAQAHHDRGAKHVLVSAPSKTLQDCDAVLLPGINLDSFDPDEHKIVSMAS